VNAQNKIKVASAAIFGLFIGLIILIVAYILVFSHSNLQLNRENLVLLHEKNILLYIIDLLPLIISFSKLYYTRHLMVNQIELQEKIKSYQSSSRMLKEFADKLTQGEIDIHLESGNDLNGLGKTLLNLRDSIKNNKIENENRIKEDKQRNWTTEGLARFSEILRNNQENLDKLSNELLLNLIHYLGANQGGFFVLNENDNNKYFELTAFYAYDRKKYIQKTFELREGLIGRCGIEMQPIFLTDIPDNYVTITSGLGTSNPRCLLLVPLISNDQLQGVIELASFEIFEKYQIDFIVKIGESIASAILSVKIADRTNLLFKDSQEKAQKLINQEETLKRAIEELKKTQEEAAKQGEQFISFTNSVNHTLIRAEYDVNGVLLYANTKFLTKLGYMGNAEVEGRHISIFISVKDLEWFNKIWEGLAKGGRHYENYMKHITKEGFDLWTMATYTCVRGTDGKVQKVLFLAIDVTKEKQQSLDYEWQISALNQSSIKGEFNTNGGIIELNTRFLNALTYTIIELRDKSIFSLLPKEDVTNFKQHWSQVIHGVPYEDDFCLYRIDGLKAWFRGTFTAVYDMYNDVSKIIFIGHEITEKKLAEIKIHEQNEQLKNQEEQLLKSKDILSQNLESAKLEILERYQEVNTLNALHEMSLEGLLDAVVAMDQDKKIILFNKAAEEIWGFSKDEVVGNHINTILPPQLESPDYLGNYMNANQDQLVRKRFEVFINNKSGEKINLLLTISVSKIDNRMNITAYLQKIEVELF